MTCPSYLEFDPETRQLSLDPHTPDFVQNPYEAYGFMHRSARAFFWRDYGHWCFAGFDDVSRLLRDRNFGRERPDYAPQPVGPRDHLTDFDRVEASSILEVEPPVHTRLRGLVNRAFVSRSIERLRPRIEAIAHQLIDGIEPAGGCDLIAAYATPLPIIVITEMMGLPAEDGPQLLDWSHAMVAMYSHNRSTKTENRANDAAREFTRYIRGRIGERRKDLKDDLLSLLIAARDNDDKLTEDELISTSILLLNAGHEATVHQTGNAIRTILRQGGDPRRFFSDEAQTAATIEECIRIDAPLHMFTRYAYQRTEAAPGVIIEPGGVIGLLLGAANRDIDAFEKPGSFTPGRADQKNASFGAGIHFCIGAPLARLEMQLLLKTLFERLPNMALLAEPQFRDSYHFHGLEDLTVEW